MLKKYFKQLLDDVSISALIAGFVVVLVGFTSTIAIIFQAAQALGATQAEINSWVWALGIGMGSSCIALSLYYKKPIVTAWSTPGAALIAATQGINLSDATGAFLVCAALITLAGLTGAFEKLMQRIPMALASAMLAGLLLRFGIGAFTAIEGAPGMVLLMLTAHLLGRRFWPRYSVLGVLASGVTYAHFAGSLQVDAFNTALTQSAWAAPIWTTPSFSVASVISLALPLFIVTMTSQNAPGVAAIRSAGYDSLDSPAPISPIIASTGALTLILAPFGAFALNLAAITAAIAMSPEAHPDPKRRYIAGVSAGIIYLLTGLFGAVIGALFAAFPAPLIAALAGLALLGTIGNSLATAVADESAREAALIAFLITASGLTLFGIGSAFWGLTGGLIALTLMRKPNHSISVTQPSAIKTHN
jgi:benzoate membrane transport protein